MSGQSDLDIWDFALRWYEGDSVAADCLIAQDTYGLDVTALIFALYRANKGQGFDAGLAVELARTVSARVIEPLRQARIALKSLPRQLDAHDAQALRERVKAAELDAEKLLLAALDRLPVCGDARVADAALFAIAATSQAGDNAHLHALLKRLALAAQNM